MTDTSAKSTVWAVVPIRDLSGAKRRLESSLSESERRDLAYAMACDVLLALKATTSVDEILIISNDRTVTELAVSFEVHLIHEGPEPGLSAAIERAAAFLRDHKVDTMLVIHGDVPLASPSDIAAFLSKHKSDTPPAITIQPCSKEDGTNVLAATPPNAIAFAYGQGSYRAHLETAQKSGIQPTVTSLQGLSIDIDTATDLEQLIECMNRTESAENTKQFLTSSGIADRFVDKQQ